MMTWRRHHGAALVATVIVRAPGLHGVAVWDDGTGVVHTLPTTFPRLESAKAAADAHLRRSFDHACRMEFCGEWMIWTG